MRFYGYTRDSLTLLYPVGKTRGDTYHWTIVSPSGTFSYVERVFTLKKQYFELGKHTITLTVTGTGCTESTTRVINLRPVFDCDASFDTVSQFAAAFGKGYHFYDNDSNVFDRTVISKFLWGDGDSSINTDYGRSSNHHVFVKPGTYNTCRMVNDTVAKCKDTVCKTITLNKADCSANFNYFTENLPDKKIRLTVKNYSKNGTMFTWKSDRHLTPWSRNREMWGEPPKTLWTSIHSLNDTLNVRYSVQDLFCADSIEKTIVLDSAKGCNAHFTIDLDTSQKFHIKLTNKSTKKASHEYLWHFGDGNSSTIRNPTHTYQTFGQFPTCLTIRDSTLKCRSQFCDTLGMDSLGKRLKVNGFTVEVNEGVLGSNRTVISTQVLYPNPSTGVFLLDLGGLTTPTVIKVTNTSGKRIKIDPFVNDQKLLLDLRNEPDGLYWITLTSGSNVYSFKALKLTN
jgi:PKD repeat protein